MKNSVVGKSILLPKEFLVDDQYHIPTDTLTVSILNTNGEIIGTHNIDQESGVYLLPPRHLTIPVDELSADYFLNFRFTIEDITYELMEPVRITRFKPITVTPSLIRNQVGATIEEMPDSSFDIYGSYLEVCQRVGSDIFTLPTKVLKANRLILLYSLLKELPTLSMRLLQSRAVDDHKYSRNKINIKAIQEMITAEYETLLAVEFELVEPMIEEPLLTVVQRSDPFTGA